MNDPQNEGNEGTTVNVLVLIKCRLIHGEVVEVTCPTAEMAQKAYDREAAASRRRLD